MAYNQLIYDVNAKIETNKFNAGSSHMVEVTHINNPKSFYVRLACLCDDVVLLESRGSSITVQDLKISDIVIYKSKVLKKHVRGCIESISFKDMGAICKMFAVDYGCREANIRSKHIYRPELDIMCPPLAVHCELHFCEPKGVDFDADALDAMNFFVGKHNAKITVILRSMDKLIVELKTLECPDDVATMLALLHYTTLTSSHNVVNRLDAASFVCEPVKYKYKGYNIGEKLCVRVQYGDSIESFYVAEVNDYKEFTRNEYDFTEYCKRQKVADVAEAARYGSACGVTAGYSMKYERAVVKRIIVSGETALVKLIDWGKEEEAKFGHIKSVESEVYTTNPAVAIHCSSTEDQVWKTSLPKFLYPGYQFIIEIIEVGNGMDKPYKVNLTPLLSCNLK